MFDLRSATPGAWLDLVLEHFDEFLLDHTLCERKASAMGMSLVAKYPDRTLILDDLIAFAREELEHFHVMYRLTAERGLVLPNDSKDAYVNELIGLTRGQKDEALFLDRLLVPGIVEARGCERLRLVTDALPRGPLKEVYLEVTRAEARHHALFLRLARRYFDERTVDRRVDELLDGEAEIVARMPFRPAVH
jgi:tRNA 2-(methylsulfanyl)-N6-isopentenyladenosine37 hydroxylase